MLVLLDECGVRRFHHTGTIIRFVPHVEKGEEHGQERCSFVLRHAIAAQARSAQALDAEDDIVERYVIEYILPHRGADAVDAGFR